MSDIARRFVFLAVLCTTVYVLLHVLRALSVESEARGIGAGAAGYMFADFAARTRTRRGKQ